MKAPINKEIAQLVINNFGINDYGKATIREVVAISNEIEKTTGIEFVHMEMGVPGLPASDIGVRAEIQALQSGVASIYPVVDGYPELKKQASSFIKAFINLDINPIGCIPVTGSMQGTYEIGRAHV